MKIIVAIMLFSLLLAPILLIRHQAARFRPQPSSASKPETLQDTVRHFDNGYNDRRDEPNQYKALMTEDLSPSERQTIRAAHCRHWINFNPPRLWK